MGARSEELFEQAKLVIPGGVNSPARAFGAVGGNPLFLEKGEGCRVTDADGKSFIDFVGSWGPLILGHAHPDVVNAVSGAAGRGTSFGAPTAVEVEIAQLVVDRIPSVEKVRMVNSGTEATMSALRLARGFTSRSKVIKFEGCWHGHADSFLIQAGSSALTTGVPDSPGVTKGTAADTLSATFNDLESVQKIAAENRDDLAAVIVEPITGNIGVVPPMTGFLEGLQMVTRELGAVLIFDEVITGFRVHAGGAQALFDVTPDMTTLGKIVGGGLPVGAFGGRADIMDNISPLGMKVSQAGTLSGNPLAMTAGLETIRRLDADAYARLETLGGALESGIRENLKSLGLNYQLNRVGSMMTLFFTGTPVTNYQAAVSSDQDLFARYFNEMLERGVYLAPSQFEALFVNLAHGEDEIDATVKANYESLQACIR